MADRPFDRPLDRPARIAVLASGRGTNLAALLRAFPADDPVGRVTLVLSNVADAGALTVARDAGVEAHHVAFPDRSTFEAAALRQLEQAQIDLVCLAGFMRVLSADFVRRFEGRLLNIHPSLLPRFRGLHPQRQALEAGVATSGCTVHLVDAGVDTGTPLLQRSVDVLPGDTEASLSERILAEEHLAYPAAVRLLLQGRGTRAALERTS